MTSESSSGVDPRAGAAGLRRNTSVAPPDRHIGVAPPADGRLVGQAQEVSLDEEATASLGGSGTMTEASSSRVATQPEARSRATTVYLAGQLSNALKMERARTKRAQVDIILDAVSEHFPDVTARHSLASSGEVDPVLGIARRSRRRVEDGRVVQLRFSESEKTALTRVAAEAEMTVSALISECLAAQFGLSGDIHSTLKDGASLAAHAASGG